MSRIDPPFRADHVGSLLRPAQVLDARRQRATGEIDDAELRAIEDIAIAEMIPKLEATGIRSITDGEFRREWFHLDFLKQLDGVTVSGMIDASSDSQETVHQAPPKITVTGKLQHARTIQVDDFEFLTEHTTQTPKVSIPSLIRYVKESVAQPASPT